MRVCVAVVVALCASVLGGAGGQQVTDLPGLTHAIKFRHYSGYLQVSPTHKLHYWFVESQKDPSSDPLLLWMNGGPGCSSMEGMLNELGPFTMNDDGATLSPNPYAWNLIANVIFLEAPAGVGFSYSTDGNVTTNDDQTSLENYEAIKKFFELYPQFKQNDFYIGGESYAGIYVPTLGKRVLDGQSAYPVNLKGLYIGNGYLDADMNVDTMIHFAYYHGLLSEHDFDFMDRTCCDGCSDFCPFHHAKGGLCAEIVENTTNLMWNGGMNPYDLYRDCAFPADALFTSTKHRVMMMGLAPPNVKLRAKRLLKYANKFKSLKGLSKKAQRLRQLGGGQSEPNCMNDTAVEMYLNREDVRAALHIDAAVGNWTMCSTQVEQGYTRVYNSMAEQIRQAVNANLRVLVYNGDTDMACNFQLGQRFAQDLDFDLITTKRPWFHDKQVAGFYTQYKGLDFVTVKGAGHMVPQWKPAQSLHMIMRFLANQPY